MKLSLVCELLNLTDVQARYLMRTRGIAADALAVGGEDDFKWPVVQKIEAAAIEARAAGEFETAADLNFSQLCAHLQLPEREVLYLMRVYGVGDDEVITAENVSRLEMGADLEAQASKGDQSLDRLSVRCKLVGDQARRVVEMAHLTLATNEQGEEVIAAVDLEHFYLAAMAARESVEWALDRAQQQSACV